MLNVRTRATGIEYMGLNLNRCHESSKCRHLFESDPRFRKVLIVMFLGRDGYPRLHEHGSFQSPKVRYSVVLVLTLVLDGP